MKHFVIFDVNKPLMDMNKTISATSPINAVKQYLKDEGINKIPKRSGSNYVAISAKEIIIRDGQKYYSGKPTQWYELTSN